MTINIITPNGSGDSLVYTCPRTAIAAEVTGSEVSSGEGKLEFKTTTGGTSATKMTIDGAGAVTLATPLPLASGGTGAVSVNGIVQVVNTKMAQWLQVQLLSQMTILSPKLLRAMSL